MRILIAALALALPALHAQDDTSASARAAAQKLTELSGEVLVYERSANAKPQRVSRETALKDVYRSIAAESYKASLAAGLPEDKTKEAEAALARLESSQKQALQDAKMADVSAEGLTKTASDCCSDRVKCSEPCCGPTALRCYDLCLGTGRSVGPVTVGRQTAALDKELVKVSRSLETASAETKAPLQFEVGRLYEQMADAASPAAAPTHVAATLSAKEIYQKDAPSVVLILGTSASGQGELGTGSVIDVDGRILTNAHVVIDDRTGSPFPTLRVYRKPAKVTGDTKRDMTDPVMVKVVRFERALDLALLEPAQTLGVPAIALGDDASVEPGDPVVAIGHPEQGGLWTLTQGVVSTVVADLGGVAGKDVFQTDASINRGNSGGPLIDRSGAIVGVNTSMARKAPDGLTITSVNFSIKSSVVRRWLGGETPSVAAATAPAAVKPAAAVELPPAPKTRPVVVTPAKPFRIDDVLEAEKELDDMGKDMSEEIRRRTQPH